MIVISAALDYATRKMDDMPLWCIGGGIALTVAVCLSGVLSW
jgi:hypothetical protein